MLLPPGAPPLTAMYPCMWPLRLMPSDITGTNVFDLASSTVTLRRGPVFTHIVRAD